MQIQVTTDANVQGHEDLIEYIEADSRRMLGRFEKNIMSVEVHLTDDNGAKHGSNDKRCLVEVRCSARKPLVASDESATIKNCFHGAVKKMQRLLESTLTKADSHKGGETIRNGNGVTPDSMKQSFNTQSNNCCEHDTEHDPQTIAETLTASRVHPFKRKNSHYE